MFFREPKDFFFSFFFLFQTFSGGGQTLLMEEGEEETSPNIGDIVEITDIGRVYSTLNEAGSTFWKGIPLEWKMFGGLRWMIKTDSEEETDDDDDDYDYEMEVEVDPNFGWESGRFTPTVGMKGTVVHVWCPYFPARGWDQENFAKVLMEVVREDQKIFYVPIGEGGIKVSQILFFQEERGKKETKREEKETDI